MFAQDQQAGNGSTAVVYRTPRGGLMHTWSTQQGNWTSGATRLWSHYDIAPTALHTKWTGSNIATRNWLFALIPPTVLSIIVNKLTQTWRCLAL